MGVGRALWYSFRYCRTPEGFEGLNRLVVLIASTRLCIITTTVFAVIIGGLVAWLMGSFDPLIFALVLIGASLAHLSDNLINDLMDHIKGIDVPGYFRTLYGPHPIIDGLITPKMAIAFVALVLAFDFALGIYLAITVHIGILILALVGVLSMALYAGFPIDAKRLGLGPILLLIIWGPVIVGGTALALTGRFPWGAMPLSLAYAATVSLILIGKHLDKYEEDREKEVGTLPVRIGKTNAMRLNVLLALGTPILATLGVYIFTDEPLLSLLPLLSLPSAYVVAKVHTKPRPASAPPRWEVWPLWYAAWGYTVMEPLAIHLIWSLLFIGLYRYGLIPYWTAVTLGFLLSALVVRGAITKYRYLEAVLRR